MNNVLAALEGFMLGILAVVLTLAAVVTAPVWMPLWLLGLCPTPSETSIARYIRRRLT